MGQAFTVASIARARNRNFFACWRALFDAPARFYHGLDESRERLSPMIGQGAVRRQSAPLGPAATDAGRSEALGRRLGQGGQGCRGEEEPRAPGFGFLILVRAARRRRGAFVTGAEAVSWMLFVARSVD